MAEARARGRIALNVAVDALLAAAAVPLARWLANPLGDIVGPPWTLAMGAAVLLVAGVPFRLSLQYWRFAAIGTVPLDTDLSVVTTIGRTIRQSSISNYQFNNNYASIGLSWRF